MPDPARTGETARIPHPPSCAVSPRYLAGAEGQLAPRVIASLTHAGWDSWTSRDQTTHLLSPDGLHGAEWQALMPRTLLDGLPVVWQFYARPAIDTVPRWNAYVTDETPHEAVTAFTEALAHTPRTALADEQRPDPLLCATHGGWSPDPTEPDTTCWAPLLKACLTQRPLPPELGEDSTHSAPGGWLAWAETADRAPRQWVAAFSALTPASLVARFATALADPAPVPRASLPPDTAQHLTISMHN